MGIFTSARKYSGMFPAVKTTQTQFPVRNEPLFGVWTFWWMEEEYHRGSRLYEKPLWCWFCRPVWQLTTACGRAAPRPCGWLISTRRERAADLLNYPEVTQRFNRLGWVGGRQTFMMANWCVWGREFKARWLTERLADWTFVKPASSSDSSV